jgi:hypothetical protein
MSSGTKTLELATHSSSWRPGGERRGQALLTEVRDRTRACVLTPGPCSPRLKSLTDARWFAAFVQGEEAGGKAVVNGVDRLLHALDEHWKAEALDDRNRGSGGERQENRPQKTALWSFSGLMHRIASGVEAGVAQAMGREDEYQQNQAYKTIEEGDSVAPSGTASFKQPESNQQLATQPTPQKQAEQSDVTERGTWQPSTQKTPARAATGGC